MQHGRQVNSKVCGPGASSRSKLPQARSQTSLLLQQGRKYSKRKIVLLMLRQKVFTEIKDLCLAIVQVASLQVSNSANSVTLETWRVWTFKGGGLDKKEGGVLDSANVNR